MREYIEDIRQGNGYHPRFTFAERIILGQVAYLIVEFHFAYIDTRSYLRDIPVYMEKRIWVALLIMPIFIIFLVISQFPRIEKRLRPRFRIMY